MSYKRPLILDNGTFREIRDGEYPFSINTLLELIDQFIVLNETPEYDIDDIKLYTTSFAFKPSSLCVYLNGIRMKQGVDNDFLVISQTSFRFNENVDVTLDDNILIDYKRVDLGI